MSEPSARHVEIGTRKVSALVSRHTGRGRHTTTAGFGFVDHHTGERGARAGRERADPVWSRTRGVGARAHGEAARAGNDARGTTGRTDGARPIAGLLAGVKSRKEEASERRVTRVPSSITMPTPVPTDILVRPRVPEAPLRPLPPNALLKSATALLASFEPEKMSLDAHADRFFAAAEEGAFGLELKRFDVRKSDRLEGRNAENLTWGAKTRHPEDQTFCRQVLYGATRYEKLLDAFMDAFYAKHASRTSRKEKLETRVCAYLALLRMDELGFGALAALLNAHPSGARFAVPFLEFLFDAGESFGSENEKVVDKWRLTYDDAYVANLVGSLDERKDDARLWIDAFRREVEGFGNDDKNAQLGDDDDDDDDDDDVEFDDDGSRVAGQKPNARNVTVPRPFNIRPSRPRPAPPSEGLKKQPFKANPVPISTHRAGPTADEIAVRRAETKNREEVMKKYADPRLTFTLRAVERPKNVDKVRAEMEAERTAELIAVRDSMVKIANPVPKSNEPGFVSKRTGPIKTTAAAILRADAVIQKKRREEVLAIEDFEAGLRDSSTYEAWRLKMRLEDEASRELEIQQTREEMARSNEEARAARLAAAAANAEKGEKARGESEALRAKQKAERDARLEKAKNLKLKVDFEKRKGLEEARRVLAEERKKNASERTRERLATAARLADERRAELAKKAELVREIRAFAAETDPSGLSSSAKHAAQRSVMSTASLTRAPLLEDMSVAELRERLALVAKRAESRETSRRARFRSEREKKNDLLAQKLADVEKHRAEASLSLKQRRVKRDLENEKRRALVAAKRAEDERLLALKETARRAEKARLAKLSNAKREADAFAVSRRPANDPTLVSRKERSVMLSRNRLDQNQELVHKKELFSQRRSRLVEARSIKERRDEENERKSKFELEYEARLRAAGKADETMRRDDARKKREQVEAERARVETTRAAFRGLAYDGNDANASKSERRDGGAVLKTSVGPATLKAAGLASDVSRGAFVARNQREKADALREAYREEFGARTGGMTRDTMLDAPPDPGGVARAVAE